MGNRLKAAIITEFHPVDMIEFHELFWRLEEFDCYVQSFDMFVTDEKNRESYDVVVYYNLSMPLLEDDNPIKKYLVETLGSTKQGIVLLHHAICCYPTWDIWTELTGIVNRDFNYHWDQTVKYDIVDVNHPITKGLRTWAMIDETYTMDDPTLPGTDILITADHPKSMKAIAWTRQYKESRVFCYESGHDDFAYNDVNFQKVLRNAMVWCSGKS